MKMVDSVMLQATIVAWLYGFDLFTDGPLIERESRRNSERFWGGRELPKGER